LDFFENYQKIMKIVENSWNSLKINGINGKLMKLIENEWN